MTDLKTDNTCWQYLIRQHNHDDDLAYLAELGISLPESLSVSDFSLAFEEKSQVFEEVSEFITKHEWLGRVSLYPTHIFTARYKGVLAGVVIMDMPTVFSKMLGVETKKLERLISRGACISWAPKNLGSALIAYAIKWMTVNTPYRMFVAYSDPEANEIGTIYQACNFFYIGQKFGAKDKYLLPSGRWVSDRYFRARSTYKRIAKELGIDWESTWQSGDSVFFNKMPVEIASQIREGSKQLKESCEKRSNPPKHKYVFISGRTKRERDAYRRLFLDRNKVYPYPKRGS